MEQMTPGARAAIIGIAAIVGGYWVHRAGQNRRLDKTVALIEQLQRDAVANPAVTAATAGIPGPPDPLPPDSCFRSLAGFEFAYVVERRADGDYLHHIIGRKAGKKAPQLSEAMLAIMRRLVQQFNPAGLEHEVMLHVEVLDSGTQHIDFMVNAEQHAAILRVICSNLS
jgi:hypothetical protein